MIRERTSSGLIRLAVFFLGHPVLLWLALVLSFLAVFIAFDLLLPLGSGPDESAHYIYSAAVVRGEAASLSPDVPVGVANISQFTCTAFRPDVTAACQVTSDATGSVSADTWVGLYNPVYYAWTGIGSLVLPNEKGLYIARALSALVTSGILAWVIAFSLRRFRSVWPAIGTLLFITPMVMYMGSVLNPSAWEIVASAGVATAGYFIVTGRQTSSGRLTEAHGLLLVSGAILLVSRGLSPLVALIIFALLVIGVGLRAAGRFFTNRASSGVFMLLGVVGIASVAWSLRVGTHYVGVTEPENLAARLNGISTYFVGAGGQLQQVFGVVGWLELPLPNLLILAWGAMVILFMGLGLLIVDARKRWMIVGATAIVVFVPAVLAGTQWGGLGWQGRYTLPFLVIAIVLAGLAMADAGDQSAEGPSEESALISRAKKYMRWGAVVIFAVSQGTLVLVSTHRYMRGDSAPVFGPISWFPPVDYKVLLLIACAGIAAVCVLLLTAMKSVDHDGEVGSS